MVSLSELFWSELLWPEVFWPEVLGDPLRGAEQIRGDVIRGPVEVLAVAAIEQHGRDARSGPGLDVAPPVADHHARSIELDVEGRGRLTKETWQRFPARAAIEVVMHAGKRQVQPEVLGDVLVVDFDRSTVDRPASDIRLVRHHDQRIAELLQVLARLRRAFGELHAAVGWHGHTTRHRTLDQGAVAIEEGGGPSVGHVVSRPSSSSRTIEVIA
jgi:hypothetical protein